MSQSDLFRVRVRVTVRVRFTVRVRVRVSPALPGERPAPLGAQPPPRGRLATGHQPPQPLKPYPKPSPRSRPTRWSPQEKRVCQGVGGRCETHDEL